MAVLKLNMIFVLICFTSVLQRRAYSVKDFPFRNTSLSWDERLDDLMKRLTLQEMVDQMAYGGGGPGKPCPAIDRLGIPPYNFDTECLRGIAGMKSTTYPQSIGLAASFRWCI